MKLASNDETLAESKVLILYILYNVKKAITNNALYKIVLSVLDMNYFYFQQFLIDLVKNDFVFTYDFNCVSRYKTILKHNNIYYLPMGVQPIMFNPIEKYERKEHFLHYINNVPCFYSMTTNIDITKISTTAKTSNTILESFITDPFFKILFL